MQKGYPAHDEPRRTEPALGRAIVCHYFLKMMTCCLLAANSLDGPLAAPVDWTERQEVGGRGPPFDRAIQVQAFDKDRTCAAIALRASFLCAAHPWIFAKPIEQRNRGTDTGQTNALAIKQKFDVVCRGHSPAAASKTSDGED